MKKCPYCAEEIQNDAIKCKHCGEWLLKASSNEKMQPPPLNQRNKQNTNKKTNIHLNAIKPESTGKYNCPSCRSEKTTCKRQIGCAVLIIIFISLGIGLIMIPFLPYDCECLNCGYKWKT
jgi:hypothetical protein